MIRIAPSILNANFDDLPGEIAKISAVSDLLHLDVMDNIFVPNLTFSQKKAMEIITQSPLPVDVHLMVADGDVQGVEYAKSLAHSVTVHLESCIDPLATLREIRSHRTRAGLAIKPNTAIDQIKEFIDEVDMILIMTVEPGFGGQTFMTEMMPKVETARKWLRERTGSDIWLEVDGGISEKTIAIARKAGADTFVAGSAVFGSEDPAEMVEHLRFLAQSIN
jgi:ribulose-phosphate 3-epimerase